MFQGGILSKSEASVKLLCLKLSNNVSSRCITVALRKFQTQCLRLPREVFETLHISTEHKHGWKKWPALPQGCIFIWSTVLGIKISHGHDHTSCATLGHFEMEFWCGTCSYDTWAQRWVQRLIVRAAHCDVTVLQGRPPREGGLPNRLKIWLFQGANDEMDWNFQLLEIPASRLVGQQGAQDWSALSSGMNAVCTSTQEAILGHPTIGARVRSPMGLHFTFRWQTCRCERSQTWAISAIDKLRPNALPIAALCQVLRYVLDKVFDLDVAMIKMHWILMKWEAGSECCEIFVVPCTVELTSPSHCHAIWNLATSLPCTEFTNIPEQFSVLFYCVLKWNQPSAVASEADEILTVQL